MRIWLVAVAWFHFYGRNCNCSVLLDKAVVPISTAYNYSCSGDGRSKSETPLASVPSLLSSFQLWIVDDGYRSYKWWKKDLHKRVLWLRYRVQPFWRSGNAKSFVSVKGAQNGHFRLEYELAIIAWQNFSIFQKSRSVDSITLSVKIGTLLDREKMNQVGNTFIQTIFIVFICPIVHRSGYPALRNTVRNRCSYLRTRI